MTTSDYAALPLATRFDTLIADGIATSWQVSVSGPYGELTLAGDSNGSGPAEALAMHRTYSAIKPLLAIAVGVLIDQAELSLDDELGWVVPDVPATAAGITVRDVLSHRVYIPHPGPVECLAVGRSTGVRMALDSARPAGGYAYSEAAAWLLLGEICEAVSGTPLDHFVHDQIINPAALGEDLWVLPGTPANYRLNYSARQQRRLPLLYERDPSLDYRNNPGFGGWATARGLRQLDELAADALAGTSPILTAHTAGELLEPQGLRDDRGLGRRCEHSLGWLTGLTSHSFGTSTEGAFGHVGMTGMTAHWYNPSSRTAGAYHIDCLSDAQTTIDWLRPVLVRELTEASQAA